jgi:putative spermidine/putrescine transport system substrate-binding protein
MKAVSYIALSFGLVAGLLAGSTNAADELRFTSWGGNFQAAQRDIYLKAFTKETGIPYRENSYQGGWGQFQAMLDSGQAPWDIVEVESAELARGCEDGLFVKLDWAKIGNRNDYIPGATSECGLGVMTSAYVFSYSSRNAGSRVPHSAADFFNLKAWPGHRGMRNTPKYNLEFALVADGVAPADVYKVLGEKGGVERAFAKLNQIKPQLQFYDATAQGYDWLLNGQTVFAMLPNGRVLQAVKDGKPLAMVWNGSSYLLDSWVALKGGNTDAAYKFMRVFSDAGRQVEFMKELGFGPVLKSAEPHIDPNVTKYLPIGGNLTASINSNSQESVNFWQDHFEDLTSRWNAWIASK